jgi:hypothetical protein
MRCLWLSADLDGMFSCKIYTVYGMPRAGAPPVASHMTPFSGLWG